jgi:hypothetical protein
MPDEPGGEIRGRTEPEPPRVRRMHPALRLGCVSCVAAVTWVLTAFLSLTMLAPFTIRVTEEIDPSWPMVAVATVITLAVVLVILQRGRPRFSLRSIVLFTVWLPSAAAMGMSIYPWRPAVFAPTLALTVVLGVALAWSLSRDSDSPRGHAGDATGGTKA